MSGFLAGSDYLDPDVAYFLGLVVARGTIVEDRRLHQIIVEIPFQNLQVEVTEESGQSQTFDIPTSIQLGLNRIRERVLELMDCDISIDETGHSYSLVLSLTRRTVGWRNLLTQLDNKVSHRYMHVPAVLFDPAITSEIRLEFIRGYADIAGNIRQANRYVDGRNRVRLDVLNDNWTLAVELCRLLQLTDVPVQNITWGHPSLGRGLREHQINIFVIPFQKVGFSFHHKQQVLNLLAQRDQIYSVEYKPCPGRRGLKKKKPFDSDETSDRLPLKVRGHFDAYWQICKAVGCLVEPSPGPLFDALNEEVEES